MTENLRDRTIADFGEQWTSFRENEGYYASTTLFADILGRLASPAEFVGKRVADIGSGTGRIVRMLLDSGAGHVVAVEPSDAHDVLVRNVEDRADRVTCLRVRGDELPRDSALDWVVSFGVLHHVPDPAPIVRAAYDALAPGGRMVVWLYGHEGNELYLGLTTPLRAVTTRLPHGALVGVSEVLTAVVDGYTAVCRRAPAKLPMHEYLVGHFGRLDRKARVLTVYDQLNPAYARYYREHEARELLERGGFTDVETFHRHGYSWTVSGRKPAR